MDRDRLVLYSPKCLSCTRLCGDMGKKKYKSCSPKKGNTQCPAQYITLVEGTDFEKASNALAKAMRENDSERLARLYDKLSEYDPVVQQRIRDMANDKLQEQ
ncbi:hypothetical protein GR11A_00045 [Vibrio phage vB_VcorM_GR11A]|nr:hypothetical protein GR11A_00045 [Vibrio phage vB_VcorM_GR11A]